MIGGKSTKTEEKQPEKNASKKKMKVPDVMDLPLSTDDEEEEAVETASSRKVSGKKQRTSSASSEDNRPARGDIQRTTFRPAQRKSTQKLEDISDGEESHASHRGKRKAKELDSVGDNTARGKRGKQISSSLPKSSQLSQSNDFLAGSQGSQRRRQATYSHKSKTTSSQDSKPRRSRRDSTSSISSDSRLPKTKKLAVKEVDDFANTPPRKATKGRLKTIMNDLLNSPEKKRGNLKVQAKEDLDLSESPPGSPKARSKPLQKSRANQTRRRKLNKGKQKRAESKSPEPPAPKPTFRMPSAIPVRDRDTISSNNVDEAFLSSAAEISDVDDDDNERNSPAPAAETPKSTPTLCPWCKEEVPEALLRDFTASKGGKRLNVTQQTIFCRKHKVATAMESWQEKGYPTIDWDYLVFRLDAHSPHMLDIINGGPSHFGDKLAKKIQEGSSRALKQEDNLYPGYYGPRGFNVMSEHLVHKYGDVLKEKAIENRVISGRGSAAFIQAVLVAELAVRLIMEDMHIGEDAAREVMEESKELGEMIHEEEG